MLWTRRAVNFEILSRDGQFIWNAFQTIVDTRRPTDEYPVDNMYARSPPNILSVYLKKTIKILSISRKSV